MIVELDYNLGEYEISLCDSYKETKYKDSVLYSSEYVNEETHDSLEDALDFDEYDRNELEVKAGALVGILKTSADNYNEDVDGALTLYGEILFTNDSIIYHNGGDELDEEANRVIIMLGDNKFVAEYGEYFISTKEYNAKETAIFSKALGKNFDVLILTYS